MSARGDLDPRDWSSHPPFVYPDYRSTRLRGPTRPLLPLPAAASERSGPVFPESSLGPLDQDLTRNAAHGSEPLGERIIIAGRVLDGDGRAVRGALVEVWQANAAGRYVHKEDQHDAPLDPNFLGAGRCVTDDSGRYSFTSVRPGAYPWGNHANAWRPAHIHFSLFGAGLASRLVTQMYFPGDPLLERDPIFKSVPEPARQRLVSRFSIDLTRPGFALGYEFDVVLRGRRATPTEAAP